MARMRETGRAAGAAAREAAPWIERLARLGYAAKGVVYLLVGGLAVAAALGGAPTRGSSGALATLSDSGPGRALLALVAVGLAGYVIWGVVRATLDPEHDGAAKRAYYAVSALVHALLGLEAARLAIRGVGGGGGDDGAAHWSATLMSQPLGAWLLGALGVLVAGFGLQQVWNAWRVDLDDQLALGDMSPAARTWAVRSGRLGLAARGVVLAIIGVFLTLAALQSDPSEARGVDGVLAMMRGTPWLLALIAVGLAAYGVYNLVRARYRVIRAA